MLFALYDWWQYRRKSGRYGQYQNSCMALAHIGGVPDELLRDLRVGDVILTQRLDSWLSWAMMYFTSSPIDHAAIYIGDARIFHVTLNGSKEHSIHVFGRNTRLLPIRFALPDQTATQADFSDQPPDPPDTKKRFIHNFAPKIQLALVALRIVAGFHPERFKWKFLADAFLLAACIDLLLYGLFRVLLVSPAVAALIGMALFNFVKFYFLRLLNGSPPEPSSHPDLLERAFFNSGGIVLSPLGPLVISELGILPLKVFSTLTGQSADDGTPNELQELRKRVLDVAEGLDACVSSSIPEDKNSNQIDDK